MFTVWLSTGAYLHLRYLHRPGVRVSPRSGRDQGKLERHHPTLRRAVSWGQIFLPLAVEHLESIRTFQILPCIHLSTKSGFQTTRFRSLPVTLSEICCWRSALCLRTSTGKYFISSSKRMFGLRMLEQCESGVSW
jgi:hypothetical protein